MLRLGPGETRRVPVGPLHRPGHARVATSACVSCGSPTSTSARRPPNWRCSCASIRHAAALSRHRAAASPVAAAPAGAARPSRGAVGAVGLVDVPAEQRRHALRWAPADGNLALVGAVRGGDDDGADLGAARRRPTVGGPHERHVYVIDARGDERSRRRSSGCPTSPASSVPTSASASRRLLQRLVDELDRRRAARWTGRAPEIIVAVDGISALRATLDGPADCDRRRDQLLRVVGEGATVGIVSVVTAERPGAVPAAVLAACAERWVFHLDDPTEAGACGVRRQAVPGAIPAVSSSRRLAARRSSPCAMWKPRPARRLQVDRAGLRRSGCCPPSSTPRRCRWAR